ncbi:MULTISPECIES: hypothetical protein [unclassified Methanoculleus]|jgi:hypothetical protein|uniref:hypothetical protein n=1 Tax=unclassified Methanoculleus TaxID=2619537 RepID=UPI0025EC8857|nr:hypothetical protein [Methanoculleus sp. UBA377]MDD2473576.1 hypothetical protein [Methanoculleus sp.]
MAADRRFLLLSAGEVLVVAAGDLVAALVLQVIVLAAFLGDLRGLPVFTVAAVLFAAVIAASGTVFLPLVGLAAALGCGYVALTLRDYRLARWAAGGEA